MPSIQQFLASVRTQVANPHPPQAVPLPPLGEGKMVNLRILAFQRISFCYIILCIYGGRLYEKTNFDEDYQ